MDPQSGFTCVTCHLLFRDSEVQREHYRSDWHRYNMKRQVAELPPVTAEQFREKVLSFQQEKELSKTTEEDFYCKVCSKLLKSKNAFENHIASKKHKEQERSHDDEKPVSKKTRQPVPVVKAQTAEPDNEEEDDGDSSGWETDNGSDDGYDYDESQALPATSCLFCPTVKSTVEGKLEHMRFHHGFLIPDKKYLTDEKGLLRYLDLKVGAGRCCIYCPDFKARYTNSMDCQKHMRDKEHCKLRRDPESMLELAEFYDYSPMYEELESAPSDVIYDDGWTLSLPSGAKIGHRSLMVYYRQYMNPFSNPNQVRARSAIDKAKGLLPALAWTNTTGKQAHQVARDLKFIERYRRRFDLRCKNSSNKARRLFKTRGRVGDN
ncbi:unnamed protein product [Auanema sp. JU1783]|nr:unnamed protein product [Auanema sp. JU1783]